ncbi:MAG: hypothetical protein ACRDV3_09885 [Acidothermaceae bacterium]
MNDHQRWRPVAGLVVVALAALAIGYKVGQATGMRVVAVAIGAVVFVAVRASVATVRREVGHREKPDVNADFPRYRHFVSALRFASNRRFDLDRATRPSVVRLFSRVLAEEHDVSMVNDRAQARALMGESAWSLVEVTSHVSPDAPGMPRKELEAIVSTLERLSS